MLRLQYFLLQALRDGESYELCLTTRLSGPAKCQPWACYQKLRQLNPAPYGAWLSFADGGPQVVLQLTPYQSSEKASGHSGISAIRIRPVLSAEVADLQVCCSSPERFLRGGRGRTLEARPIKVGDTQRTGSHYISATTSQRAPDWHHLAMAARASCWCAQGTAPRAADPATDAQLAAALQSSPKDRAENLMIVDLLRNDLVRRSATCCMYGRVSSWQCDCDSTNEWYEWPMLSRLLTGTAGPGLRAGVRACAGPNGAGVLCHCAPAGQHRARPEAPGKSASQLLLCSDPGAAVL